MMGMAVRTIGLARSKTKIDMVNITYNIRRLAEIADTVTA